MVHEHLNWKPYIKIIENKLSKNLGLWYETKHFFNANAMKSIFLLIIHSYVTYRNVAWCRISMNKTKQLCSKQKKAIKIILIAGIHAKLDSDEKNETFRYSIYV